MKSYGLLSVAFVLSAFIFSPLLINPVYATQSGTATDMKVLPKDAKKTQKNKTVMQQNSEPQPSATMKKVSDHGKSKPAVSTPQAVPSGNASDAQGATARCKDGSYSHSQHHSGSCSRHGGVANWL